ncbi:3-oxoadipate enol-lactonase [Gordonia caeni]|uniref:3-oxoadipate enol-lactonase n=1 Tax=Gordonia caeni TaxID=1007097 RepID=A0ABP7NUB5_9ACTN
MQVHAVAAGPQDAPVVVLANSLGADLSMWDPQVAALAERFRVIGFDTRGHGSSPVPSGPYTIDDLAGDVVALIDRFGVDRAALVGLSLGGTTMMRVAARHPDRVTSLAVLCTAPSFDAGVYTERAAAIRAAGTTAGVAEGVVSRWFTDGFRSAHPERTAAFETMVAGTPAEGYAGCCDALSTLNLDADLPRISAPTLVIAGADDVATPPKRLAEIADAVPDSRLLVVPGACHLANVEQPEAVTAALLEHLESS